MWFVKAKRLGRALRLMMHLLRVLFCVFARRLKEGKERRRGKGARQRLARFSFHGKRRGRFYRGYIRKRNLDCCQTTLFPLWT